MYATQVKEDIDTNLPSKHHIATEYTYVNRA